MKYLALVLQVLLSMPAGDEKTAKEFANTESLTITYRVSGRDKVLIVKDHKKVREVIEC